MSEADIHIGIDVGGTFTDVAVSIPSRGRLLTHKLPSTPDRPDRAIMEGIADVLSEHGLGAPDIARLHHGTTIGTNALIQRRCGKVAVVTTEGFRDLLEIGRQIRPKVYDIHTDFPPPLVPRDLRFEVKERMRADGVVHVPLAEQELESIAAALREEDVDCVVVCFINAYAYPAHERHAAEILRQAMPDGVPVVASSEVFSEFREYERFSTAVLNGALLTVIREYAERLASGVSERGIGADLKVSQSAGGLMSLAMARRLPIRTALSGPAAGVIGAAARAQAAGFPDVITLDVGGTSSDVSLLRDGTPSEVQDRSLAGFPLRVPALDVNAIGAGGGSIAWIDVDGLLKVGPQSAGASPGPACYDQGGTEATVTDANVLIGRLNGEALLDGRMPIDARLAEQSVADLATRLGARSVRNRARHHPYRLCQHRQGGQDDFAGARPQPRRVLAVRVRRRWSAARNRCGAGSGDRAHRRTARSGDIVRGRSAAFRPARRLRDLHPQAAGSLRHRSGRARARRTSGGRRPMVRQ